jgi:dihydroorotase
MADIVIRGGRVVDANGSCDADVLVLDGRIVAVERVIDAPARALVIDAAGCVVAPGLVDLHTHLRQPGNEEAETVETGARAAALGGYTAIVAMPNTDPAIDCAPVVRDVLEMGRAVACRVAVAGAISVGRKGEQLAPMAEMASLGVRIFTDDGTGVQDAGLMRRALEYARPLGVTLAQHCEDESLAAGGHMHEGAWSSRLGIPGRPAIAEECMVARDLALARLTGAPLHLLHLSCAGSVELVRQAKAAGLPVTAEATPHHLALTDGEVVGYDPVFKVHPPLRTRADVEAVRAGVADGTIDAIATDHAPHSKEAKEEPFDQAPAGMIGLETALAVAHGALCLGAGLPIESLFERCSWGPARIAGLDGEGGHGGPIAAGRPANLVVFDPKTSWTVDASHSASRSRNTPFAGRALTGRVRHTVLQGEPVVLDGEAQR